VARQWRHGQVWSGLKSGRFCAFYRDFVQGECAQDWWRQVDL